MYQPPPGRPISSPPSTEPKLNGYQSFSRPYRVVTDEERAGIVADYNAGMSWHELSAKYDRAPAVLGGILARTKKRSAAGRPPKTPQRPERIEGETNQQYGRRVQAWMMQHDPAYIERWKQRSVEGRNKARALHKRQAKAACIFLNKTETRGVWHTAASVSASYGDLSPFRTSQFVTKNALEIRRFGPFKIYLIPSMEAEAPLAADIPPAFVAAPPLTLWQRIVGWFR